MVPGTHVNKLKKEIRAEGGFSNPPGPFLFRASSEAGPHLSVQVQYG